MNKTFIFPAVICAMSIWTAANDPKPIVDVCLGIAAWLLMWSEIKTNTNEE